jgi:hypothetical protein
VKLRALGMVLAVRCGVVWGEVSLGVELAEVHKRGLAASGLAGKSRAHTLGLLACKT